MKKGLKLGSLITLIGAIITFLAISIGGTDIFNTSEERVQKTYTFSNNYKNIHINETNLPIYIKPSPDNDIHLTTFESDKQYYKIDENTNLSIEFKNNLNWLVQFSSFEDFNKDYYIELLIPKNCSSNLKINSTNGKVYISDILCDDIDVTNVNGQIQLENIKSNGDITLETVNSEIILENAKTNDLEVSNVNGKIDIYEVDAENIDVDSVNGEINLSLLGKIDDYTFDIEYVNGTSTITDENKKQLYDVQSFGNGKKEVNINTVNGKISIDIN